MAYISIGSNNHFYNPVKELINVSNRLHKKYSNAQNNNNDFEKLLSRIPLIEGSKIESLLKDINSSNFKSKLQKFGYNSFDFFNLEKQFPIIQNYPDIKNMVIYYFCIFWYFDSTDQYDFSTILSLLNITRENSASVDLTVHDFCFELILNKAISASKSNIESTILVPLFLTYIMTLKNLPNTSFNLLYTLFNMASSTDNEADINLLHETIEYIFINNFDFLKSNEYPLLLDTLKINFDTLDPRSLKILGQVTHRGKASIRIMEIIHALYKQFYEFILLNCEEDKTESPFQKVNEDKDKLIRFEKQSKLPKKTFKFDVKKNSFQIIQFPYSILSFKGKKKRIVNDLVYSKVQKFSDFLECASSEVVLDFIAQFSVFLGKEKFFFEICDSFIEILIASADSKIIKTITELLSQSKLFLPSITVFDNLLKNSEDDKKFNFYLDERINYLRDRVFELISIQDPTQVSILLSSSQYYPFLFTEHLIRILLRFDQFAPQLFYFEQTKSIIINSGFDLEYLINNETNDYNVIMCVYLTFISQALCNSNLCDLFYSYPSFINYFLSFLYQTNLQKFILNAFQKSLSIVNKEDCQKYSVYIVDFFQKMTNSSIEEKNSYEYQIIIERAFSALTIGLQYNISIAHNFISLFETLLNFISFSPSINLILISLKLFQVFSFTENHWKLSSHHFLILHSAIDQLCGENPDDRIITSLFCCLGKLSFLNSKDSIVIVYPSILPLLFLIHSKSRSKNIELLKTFNNLCSYSDSNALSFHEAFVDLILIQYLCLESDEGKISFFCHDFEFNMDREEAIPVILDILWVVSPSRPNFSISSQFVDLLTKTKNEKISNFIISMLYNGESSFSKMTKIPLDSSDPVICVNGFDWSTLKNIFVLDFYLTVDEMISKRYHCCFSIFKITDDVNTLQIIFTNGSLQASFKTPDKSYSAFLFKNIFNQKQSSHFTITFINSKEKTKIFNFLNGERFSDASIEKIYFNRNVRMFIGGSDFVSKYQAHPCFGKIFDFKFFACKLNEDEITLLNEEPSQFTKKPLFSTNFIKSEASRVYTIEYKDSLNGGVVKMSSKNRLLNLDGQQSSQISLQQSSSSSNQLQQQQQQQDQEQQEPIQKLTLELLPSFHRSYHILDFFCETSLFPKYLQIQRLDVLLDVIFCIFTKHPEFQKLFKPYVNTLYNHVIQKVEYSTYLSLFRFMGILKSESMRLEWFEMFIINIVLWSKSSQFNQIVNHWNMSLKQCKSYFIDKNYLNDLLTQFMLRFQFEKDPESNNDEIMKVFCRFMINIAQLNFDQNSFDILISCILMCEDESNLYELVKILDSISLTQAAMNSITKKKLQLLHKLFRYQNIELTICSIICLNNLSIIFPDYDCFAIAYILIGHQELDEIVEILISKFPDYPNLMSLLVVLSLQAKKQELLVNAIKQHFLVDSSNINMIFSRDYWYIWPILLILNSSDESCDVICHFLAIGIFNLQIANSNDRSPVIDDIFLVIFRLSYLRPTFPIAFRILEILMGLFEMKNTTFPQYISRYSFIFFFFKCPGNLHSDPLLQIYKESDFCENESSEKNEKKLNSEKMIFNIFELESLLGFDLFSFVFLCRIDIDSSSNLIDKDLIKLYLKLDPPNTHVFDKRMMTFFTIPYDPSNTQNYDFELSYNQISLFDSFQNEIKNFFSTKLNLIRKGILKLFQKSRINIANISSDEMRPFTHILLSKASNQLQRTTPKIEKEIQVNLKKKENKLSPMLYPYQLKNSANSRKNKAYNNDNVIININNNNIYNTTFLKMFGKPVYTFNCIISKFDYKKSVKGLLYLYDNLICFSPENKNKKKKFIHFNDIKYFLVRKVKDGFGYEIITETLTTILFFIKYNDFNALTMELKLYHFTNASLFSFSSDFCSSLLELTKSWINRRTSNFEYLMKLNIVSGRSFNQHHLYPVMPAIVSVYDDYNSEPNYSNLKPVYVNSPFDDFFDMSNRENFTNYLTLMADYFFDFTLVNNKEMKQKVEENDVKIVLPKWASSKFEFIYLNRKKLENLDITTFIDKIFGYEHNVYNGPFLKLFKKPHEKRKPLKPKFSPLFKEILASFSAPNSPNSKSQSSMKIIRPTPLFVQDQIDSQMITQTQIEKLPKSVQNKNINGYSYHLPHKIISSLVFLNQNSQIRFWMILDNHKLCYVQINDGYLRIKYQYELDGIDINNDDLVFFSSQTVLYIYSMKKSTVYFLNLSKSISKIPLYTELPLFAIFDDQIICSQRECSLYKMSVGNLNFSRICLTNSKLTALSSSKSFNLITYATIDGIVHILSFSTSEEINQYKVGFEVKQILITSCMGFIIILGDDKFVALTVNGEFITKYHFDFLIKNLYSLTYCAGIDFVAFDNFNNEIGYFEVFYPQKYKIIKKFNSEVKRVSYDPFDYVFIVVQENGYVELIYHSIYES